MSVAQMLRCGRAAGWTDALSSIRIERLMKRRAPTPPTYEFHVSRDARQRYEFDDALFGLTGNVVFADFGAARRFAQKMNAQRDLAADPGAAVRPGDINAMGLIDEILH